MSKLIFRDFALKQLHRHIDYFSCFKRAPEFGFEFYAWLAEQYRNYGELLGEYHNGLRVNSQPAFFKSSQFRATARRICSSDSRSSSRANLPETRFTPKWADLSRRAGLAAKWHSQRVNSSRLTNWDDCHFFASVQRVPRKKQFYPCR